MTERDRINTELMRHRRYLWLGYAALLIGFLLIQIFDLLFPFSIMFVGIILVLIYTYNVSNIACAKCGASLGKCLHIGYKNVLHLKISNNFKYCPLCGESLDEHSG